MSDEFTLVAESRTDVGKGASRRLRRTGKVPAILYGGDQEPTNLAVSHNEVLKRLRNDGFYSHVLTLQVEGKSHQAILRDMQRHPYKPSILHMDFQRVLADRAVHVHVPLHFVNEAKCKGVKTGGGAISHHMMEIEVECLPGNLPEFIEVDLINVDVGEAINLSQLSLPEGVTVLALQHGEEYDTAVVSVHKIHAAEDLEEDEEEGEGGAGIGAGAE